MSILPTQLFEGPAGEGSIGSEEGFVDLNLPLAFLGYDADGTITAVGRARVADRVVSLMVRLCSEWSAQRTEDSSFTAYWGNVEVRTTGVESNSLVELLSTLYSVPCTSPVMPAQIQAQAVGLNDNPSLAAEATTHIKLFFSPHSEDEYAEAYLNINHQDRMLEFHEKDPEYRANLLRALGGCA